MAPPAPPPDSILAALARATLDNWLLPPNNCCKFILFYWAKLRVDKLFAAPNIFKFKSNLLNCWSWFKSWGVKEEPFGREDNREGLFCKIILKSCPKLAKLETPN